MTQTEALKLALEALELHLTHHEHGCVYLDPAVTAIKEALAQPEQEPVAWFTATPIQGNGNRVLYEQVSKQYNGTPDTVPLYTTPPQRTWVGLTEEEIVDAYDVAKVSFKKSQQGVRGQMLTSHDSPDWHYAKAIEAKLKEKNHG